MYMYLIYFSDILCIDALICVYNSYPPFVSTQWWKSRIRSFSLRCGKHVGVWNTRKPSRKYRDTELENLKHTIKKMEGRLTDTHDGIDLCIADEHYKMHNKLPTLTAKKLLLSLGAKCSGGVNKALSSPTLFIVGYEGKKL